MSKRAERRMFRLKKINRVKHWPWIREGRKNPKVYGYFDDSFVAKMATTPHPCSCIGCGNPRKNFKEKTLQEQKMELTEREELAELDQTGEVA